MLLLTEDDGYPALVNTDFLVSATVEKVKDRPAVHTVVSLSDGSNIRVEQEPGTILEIAADQSFQATVEYDDEEDEDEDLSEFDYYKAQLAKQEREIYELQHQLENYKAMNIRLMQEHAILRRQLGNPPGDT